MDTAESLKNHKTCILDKLFQTSDEEEICQKHSLTLVQLSTSCFEVEVDIEMFNKLCDRIP